jgi:hypothetical protein
MRFRHQKLENLCGKRFVLAITSYQTKDFDKAWRNTKESIASAKSGE